MLKFLEIVETLKLTHRILLNEAAALKSAHDKVEVSFSEFLLKFKFFKKNQNFSSFKELKKNYLIYRKNVMGDSNNIFELESDENSRPTILNSNNSSSQPRT